jgi:cystathionine beta-lyase/cystathionine gamma-synthase
MERHEKNAHAVAEALVSHLRVKQVYSWPAIASRSRHREAPDDRIYYGCSN